MQCNNNTETLNQAHLPAMTELKREKSLKVQQKCPLPQRYQQPPTAQSDIESKQSVTSFYADGNDVDLNGSKDDNQYGFDTMSDSDEEAKFLFD